MAQRSATMAEDTESRIEDLCRIISLKAPVLAPTQLPLTSSLGAADSHECVAGLFSTPKQRKAVAASLADRRRRAKRSMGCEVHLVLADVDVDVGQRTLTLRGLRFVGAVEAVLYDAKRFLNLELAARSAEELEPYVAHFRAKNGYDGGGGNPAMVVQDVYNAAYSLSVLLDNVQGWQTRVRMGGGSGSGSGSSGDADERSKGTPLRAAVDVEGVLDSLFAYTRPVEKKRPAASAPAATATAAAEALKKKKKKKQRAQ